MQARRIASLIFPSSRLDYCGYPSPFTTPGRLLNRVIPSPVNDIYRTSETRSILGKDPFWSIACLRPERLSAPQRLLAAILKHDP